MKHHKRTVLNRTHRGLDEVSVVIDGERHQARIEGAGRGWIHLSTSPIQPADPAVKLSVIHRGPRGGLVEVQASCLTVHHRGNRTILRLRPEQAKTARGREFLDNFLEKTLGYPDHDLLSDTATVDELGVSAQLQKGEEHQNLAPSTRPRPLRTMSRYHRWSRLATTVNYPALCWTPEALKPATIRRVSGDGRRLFLSWHGTEPEIWEQLKIEVNVGESHNPKPITLQATVVGTCRAEVNGETLLIVRLVRVASSLDQRLWQNALRRSRPTRTRQGKFSDYPNRTDSSPRC